MFYRSSNRAMLAVVLAAMLGAFAAPRADGQARSEVSASDLEKQVKEKQEQLEELKKQEKAQQAKAAIEVRKITAEAKAQADRAIRAGGAGGAGFASGESPIRVRVQMNAGDPIRTAAAEVRDAKSDDERKAAQKKLDEALGKYFDDDMVQREKDLKQVEERVAKLHEQLEKRRSNKQEIIELESKVVMNQANGLGFYDNDDTAGGLTPGGQYIPGAPFKITTDGRGWGATSVPKVGMTAPSPPSKPSPPADVEKP